MDLRANPLKCPSVAQRRFHEAILRLGCSNIYKCVLSGVPASRADKPGFDGWYAVTFTNVH
jgi:hypothetical protein